MIGMDADMVLVDMDLRKNIEAKDVQSKCGWTPYEFFDLKGWPIMTIVNGEVVVEKGKLQSEPSGVLV